MPIEDADLGDTPAARAAEELLAVVLAGDDGRTRDFIDQRYSPELLARRNMDEHARLFRFFGEDLEGRAIDRVRHDGPAAISIVFASARDRVELRLGVEPEPPHRIVDLRVMPAGPALEARSLEELPADLERMAKADEFSGVVLVAEGDSVQFHGAFGLADRTANRPNRPETPFDVGSITKLFTATAVLRLAQQGRLGLDDPIGRYLEGFPQQIAEKVTIRHLLRHRSGFGDYLGHPDFRASPKEFDEPSDFLPLARAQELAFEPGTDDRYSNVGFVLLGAIIEEVTGRGYHDVIDELVFRPAGMQSSSPSGGATAARRYTREDGRFVSADDRYPDVNSPAGGGFAAATDLLHFATALLEGRLLDTRHTALLLNRFEEEADSLPEQFGFAGGAPGLNALLGVRPSDRQIIVVLANMDPPAAMGLARSVQELVE